MEAGKSIIFQMCKISTDCNSCNVLCWSMIDLWFKWPLLRWLKETNSKWGINVLALFGNLTPVGDVTTWLSDADIWDIDTLEATLSRFWGHCLLQKRSWTCWTSWTISFGDPNQCHWRLSRLMMKSRYLRQTRISSPSLFSLFQIKFWNWPQWFDQNHKIIHYPSLWSLIKTLPYCKINSHILLWNAKIYLPFKPSADLNALLWAESSLSGNDSLRFSWLKKGRFSSFKTEFPSPKIAFLPLNIPCVKDQMWLYLSALIHPVASCLKQVLLT